VTTIEAARAVLAAVEAESRAYPSLLLAHRLIALTGVRKREATEAQWREIDLAAATWTIPAERMKSRRVFVVTLAPQAVEVLRAARRLAPSGCPLVFPATDKRIEPLDDSTMNEHMKRALVRAEIPDRAHVPHGWRSTLFTVMKAADHTLAPILSLMLDHLPDHASKADRNYDSATLLPERRAASCAWADLLMVGAPSAFALVGLQVEAAGDNVIPLRRAA
jgi:integrase